MTDRQLIEDLLSALEYHTEQTRPIEFSKVAIEAAREYLHKPAQQQEPVAWIDQKHLEWLALGPDKLVGAALSACQRFDNTVALYTSPQASKPLTDEQITVIAREHWGYAGMNTAELAFARAIEAANGIKGDA